MDGIEPVQRLDSVACHLDLEAFTLQPYGERFDEGLLILDDAQRRGGVGGGAHSISATRALGSPVTM